MNTRELLVTFTETVNASTFVPSLFTFSDSDVSPTTSFNLTTSGPTSFDLAVVTILLSDADFNMLTQSGICTTMLSCYLTVEESAIQDVSGLFVLEDTEPVDSWLPDGEFPTAVEFNVFNLLNGTITIEFSETVDPSSINFGALTFQSLYEDPIDDYTLTSGSSTSELSTVVEIQLTAYDLNRIKEKEYLCTTQGSCYITFTPDFIKDIAGNSIVEQVLDEAPGLIAMEFVPDTSAPEFVSFVYDAKEGSLLMTFTEPVEVELIDPTGIHLQGEANTTEFYTLTGGTAGTSNSDEIVFNLSTTDFNAIQSLPYATRQSDTYISIESFAFRDTSLMPVFIIPVPNDNARQASDYIIDDDPPEVESFTLNLETDELLITFSEAIALTSVSASELVLIGNESIPSSFVPLTGGIVRPVPESNEPGSVIITIELNEPDIVAIKTNTYLATSVDATFLRVEGGFVTDTSGVPIEADLVLASALIPDDTAAGLVSFALDVNNGELSLTFSDVVDASTFDTRAITIQSALYSNPENQYTLTTSSTASDTDGYYVEVSIGPVDLFRLKSTPGVATSINNTYITMFASAVDDTFGVDVLSITNGKALPADTFTEDTDPPLFTGFNLDMSNTTLTLFFSEAVNISTLIFENLVLYTDQNISLSTSNFTITGGDLLQSDDGQAVSITLSTEDANAIQADELLAVSEDSTFLSLPYGSIQDIVGHNTTGTSEGIAVRVSNYTIDLLPPTVLRFSLDTNLGWLNITFSETINITTVDVTQISFQNRKGFNQFTHSVTLTNSVPVGEHSEYLSIDLSADDLNSLKISRPLAVDRESTNLVILSGAVKDMANNSVVTISDMAAMEADEFYPDVTEPELVSYDFNRTSGELLLTFTEVIDHESLFDYTTITIFNDSTMENNLNYTLREVGEIYPTGPPYRPEYTLQLTFSDVSNLKRLIGLATFTNNTFLALLNTTTHDYATNPLNETSLLRAREVYEDQAPPQLIGFLFDVDAGELLLSFDDIVEASSLVFVDIQLFSSNSTPATNFTLTGGSVEDYNDYMLLVSVTEDDLNEIKVMTDLASNPNNTYITLEPNSVYDTAGNGILEFVQPLMSTDYIYDTTRPRLLSWNISIDAGEIRLLFSEAVDHSTLDATLMVLQSAESFVTNVTSTYTLSSSSIAEPPDGILIVVNISRRDLDAIKDITDLAALEGDTYLSFPIPFILDMNLNTVRTVQDSMAKQASTVFPDITQPTLVSFTLDLEDSSLLLSFSETINPDTFNITEITLHNNAAMEKYQQFQITPLSSYTRTDYSEVQINLNISDLNIIKSYYNLGTTREDTFISLTSNAAEDRNDNKIEAVAALMATSVGQDMIRPVLQYFDIDFTYENFTLYFSETVNITTFDVTQITFVHNHTDVSYALTGGVLQNTIHDDILTISFTKEDRDNITRLPLCTQQYDCLLSFSSDLVMDAMENRVEPVSRHPPRVYVEDTSSTRLVSFTLLDFDSGVITIEFREIIDSQTINPQALRLQNSFFGESAAIMLTGGNVTSSNGTIVTIIMTNDDLNKLKAAEISSLLCRTDVFCHIRLLASFANDTFGNPIEPVENSMNLVVATIPSLIAPDTTPPTLLNFDIDLTDETITLYFSETVDHTGFNSRFITIQNAAANASASYRLSADDEDHTSEFLPTITFTLLPQHVIAIKAIETLATGPEDTYISLTSNLVADTSGNDIVDIGIDEAVQVQTYSNDTISPTLVSLTRLDMDEGVITLSFSEPVNASTVVFSEFALHTDSSSSGVFNLTGGNTSFPDPDTKLVLQISFSAADLRQIKLQQNLAMSRDSSYLSFTSSAILDMAGNPVVAILPTQADTFRQDETSPVVLGFALNMNTSELTITFDDVISRESLRPQFISLQNTFNGSDDANAYTLTKGSTNSSDGYEIVIDIHPDDLNEIKMRDRLATERNTTYLVLTASSFREVAGSPVTPILADGALITSSFQPDVTSPELVSFSLSLESEVLVLMFSEAINVHSLDLNQLTLQSEANRSADSEVYTLTGGTPDPPYTGVNITISLTKNDLDEIKGMTMLGTTINNTYITFPETVLHDMNRQPIVGIESTSALRALSLSPDIFPPAIVQYCLNMSREVYLELTFSETINSSSLEPSFLTLQSSPGSAPLAKHQLVGGAVETEDEIVVIVYLTTGDANEVKRLEDLATSSANTYLTFLSGMVYDYALPPQAIVGITDGIPVNSTCFTPDDALPVLEEFNLNLGNDTLTLFFSETVSIDRFNFTGITLIGADSSSQRQLTGGTLLTDNNHIISFTLAFDDANYIKNISDLATTEENTFIVLTSETLQDMNGNAIETIEVENAVPVTNLTFDETSPVLQSFNFDLNTGRLTLSFTETVAVSTLDVTQVTILDGPTGVESHVLGDGSTTSSPNGPVVVIQLSDDDLNRVKQLPVLATHANYTWITLTSATINDTSSNPLHPVDEPQMVSSGGYIADNTRPKLLSFRLDTEESLSIVLTFSETVSVDTLDPTQFQLSVYPNDTCTLERCSYNLTGGNVSSIDSTEVTINVTQTDLEEIRLVPPLGHSVDYTFLSISELSVKDMANFPVDPISTPALPASDIGFDLVPPFLVRFDFDLDSGTIEFIFSEEIDISTLVIERITLQNSPETSSQNLTLNETSYSSFSPGIVSLSLSLDELNTIKILRDLATHEGNTYFSLEPNIVNDLFGNDALPIPAPLALNEALPDLTLNHSLIVTDFTPDTTRPRLISFDLNMRTRELELTFSETVNASSFDLTSLTFVDSPQGTMRHTLTGGNVTSSDGPIISITISTMDKNSIKTLEGLAVSNETTYIRIRPTFVADNAYNLVHDIPFGSPLRVDNYTADVDRPILLSFDLDMDGDGLLTLHFSETVNVDTLIETYFTLQDNQSTILQNHTFTNSMTDQIVNAADVEVPISCYDLNEIKRKQFCNTPENCYLSFEDEAVIDMVGLPIEGVPDGQAMSVSGFTNDTTPPQLEEFTLIDLTAGTIMLSFSETINASSLNFAEVVLQDLYRSNLATLQLTGGSTNDSNSDIIQFTFEPEDLYRIQANEHLCTHQGNCYITFSEEFVTDMAGNAAEAIGDEFPGYNTMDFNHDEVPPELIEFTLELENGTLLLTFNESVRASSLDATGLTIQASQNTTDPGMFYTLTEGSTTASSDGTVIEVVLSVVDRDRIKGSLFANTENDTYLSLLSHTITDAAFYPNSVVEIPSDMALQVAQDRLIVDRSRPTLFEYTLDITSDLLILTFNEPIEYASINCTEVTLYNTSDGMEANLTLTGCTVSQEPNMTGTPILTLQLTGEDITALKSNVYFATPVGGSRLYASENTFLSFTSRAFQDTSQNPVTEVIKPRAVDTFIPDFTRPALLSFTYDQHLGQINLMFSDVVDAATFDARAITLQHGMTRASDRTFTPSTATMTSSSDGYLIVVDLDHFDLLTLKSNTGLARNEDDTYITIAAFLIDDRNGFDVAPITDGKAIPVDVFVPDDIPPVLNNFTMDMDMGQILLTFSDTVNSTTFDPTGIVIQAFENSTGESVHNILRLNGGGSLRSDDGLTITVQLLVDDLNELKRNTNLSTSYSNTYLAIDEASVFDLAGNPLVGINETQAVQPAVFHPDNSTPFLVSFNLDMNSQVLFLTFDETVDAQTLDISQITLQNSRSLPSQNYTLGQGSTSSQNDSVVIEIYLSAADVNEINRQRELASDESNTYLTATELTIRDMNGNYLYPVGTSEGVRVTNFTRDEIPPQLLEYDLDMDEGLLTLYFTEVVDYASFDPSALTLYGSNDTSMSVANYTLLAGEVQPADDMELYLYIDIADLNEIKRLSMLAVDNETTFLSLLPTLVVDTFDNNVTQNTLLPISEYTRDTTPPELVEFVLDLNEGELSLTFNETVNASSLTIEAIAVVSGTHYEPESYRLQFSSYSLNDNTSVVVYLEQRDLDQIKLNTYLATDENNTFLNLSDSLVRDMSGSLFIESVHSGRLIEDQVAPELLEFTFDLDRGVITLNFTEAVNTSSLNVNSLVLYASNSTVNISNYRLAPPTGTYAKNGKVFSVVLSDDDLNAIKADYNLASDEENTFLAVEVYAIEDMSGNAVTPTAVPVMAALFGSDVSSPNLTNATFNFNGGVLTLTFSETVNVDTFQAVEVTLKDHFSDPTSYQRLSGGTFSTENSTVVTLYLTEYDLNVLKNFSDLFTTILQAYVSVTNLTVEDMSGNPVHENCVEVADIIEDNVRPEIIDFELDLNEGMLVISFSETINIDSFSISNLWIQNRESNSSHEHRLSSAESAIWNITIVIVTLSESDLDSIKLLEALAVDNETTYLRFNSDTATDTAMMPNELATLNETQGIQVALFTPDQTPPELVSFDLDMDSPEMLVLTFSEPVQADSVSFTAITLQAVRNTTNTSADQYTLMNGTVTSNNSRVVTIDLAFEDTVRIQAHRDLAHIETPISTYISLETGAVLDMNNVSSVNVSQEEGIPVTQFTADNTNPVLDEYSVDLNAGVLTLTFTETVDTASVGAAVLVLHGTTLAENIQYENELNATSNNPEFTDWYIIDITFSYEQLNEIKLEATGDFYTEISTSYLSIPNAPLPKDTADNEAVPKSLLLGKQVSMYTPDTTKPVLISFAFDVSGPRGIVYMNFSEPVLADSLEPLYIEFHNSPHNETSSAIVRLTGETPGTNTDGLTLQLTLSHDDFNTLKSQTEIATSYNDTYLFLLPEAVTDVFGNNVSQTGGRTVPASDIQFDNTHPELDSFSFDLNTGTLYLTFSESVNASTLNTTSITIQSNRNGDGYSYVLTDGSGSDLNQPEIVLNLTVDDLNAIKAIRGLGTTMSNTFVAITSDAILDMVGLNLTEIQEYDALQAATVYPDITPPTLESFRLNLSTNELLLTFDETISVGNTFLTLFTLQSAPNSSSVTLTIHSSVSANDSTEVVISLGTFDLDRIKLDTTLAVNTDTTQLVLGDGAVTDMSGQSNNEQIANSSETFPDLVSPRLRTFVFDLDAGRAILNFDEAVNATSVNIAGLSFLNDVNGSVVFTLSGVTVSSSNGQRVELVLEESDLNEIKQNTSLLTAMADSYLTLSEIFISDMNGNQLVPVANRIADQFFFDETSPELISFDLDMTLGHLILLFNETVNASSFDPTGITLQSQSNSEIPDTQYQLTTGALLNDVDDTTLTLVIDTDDLNEIKTRDIARDNDTTWLALDSGTVRDMNDRPVRPLVNGVNTMNVANYTADMRSPQLVNFTLNLTSEVLILTFDETVDIYSLNVTYIVLQNTSTEPLMSYHTLSNGSRPLLLYLPIITINLSLEDLNEIKGLIELGTTTENTFISLTSETISDRAGNPVELRPPSDALMAQTVFGDSLVPSLEEFDFNLDRGVLTLSFSETVSAGSVVFSGFTLHNSTTGNIESYQLTSGAVISGDGPVIQLMLSDYDLNEIKHNPNLASGSDNVSDNTYLSITPSVVNDTSGNPVTERPPDDSLMAVEFISDTTRPELTGFTLDLDTGVVTLNFTEAVNGATLISTGLTFRNTNSSNATYYTLTGGYSLSSEQDYLEVAITDFDLDNIKALLDLGTTPNNTYLDLLESSVEDTSGNPVVNVSSSAALEATSVTPDQTRPTLVEFHLDMNSGNMTLSFSETISTDSVQYTEYTVQARESLALIMDNAGLFYTLTNGSVTTITNTQLVITLVNSDLNEIKRRPMLASEANNTYLSFTETAIRDTSNNLVSPNTSTNAVSVMNYTKDSTPPELISFSLDLNIGQLILRFSETVNTTTLIVPSLQISDVCPRTDFYTLVNVTANYTLTET